MPALPPPADRRLLVPRTGLPVESAIDAIGDALGTAGSLVLTAEPGAGKSTLVPLIAANHTKGRVVLLQPRRLAARATATRLAELVGVAVGDTVGLTMRGERRTGRTTRIEVVTEAVLTNRLLADPELPGIGCVIFDEFHERSLDADLGLGMAIESRAHLRPDLLIVVMSATIDAGPVARLLGDAPVVSVPGRTHTVLTRHRHRPPRSAWVADVAEETAETVSAHPGDALVFVPGRRDAERVCRALDGKVAAAVYPLHGGTAATDQRTILGPAAHRRIIVATAVAETSVTVPGVRIVVDGGLARRPRFDPTSGLGHLETVFVPRFGADQRRGRAGRIDDGVCVRLWSTEDERHLAEAFDPEIVAGDPLPLAIALCAWGDPNAATIPLLDHPGEFRLAAARAVLEELGLIDGEGRLTNAGRATRRLPVHPRSAAALLTAAGTPAEAEVLVAIAGLEEDVRPPGGDLERLQPDRDRLSSATSRLRRQVQRLEPAIHERPPAGLAEALLDAWPDRVAAARPGRPERFQLASGAEVTVPNGSPLLGAPFLVVAAAGGLSRNELTVRAAVATDRRSVLARLEDRIVGTDEVEWDDRTDRVVATRVRRLGAIVLHRETLPDATPGATKEMLLDAIRRRGVEQLDWTDRGRQLRARLAWLHDQDPDRWPDVGDAVLVARLEDWLEIDGIRALADLRIDAGHLLRLLDWRQRADLDRLAPPRLEPPRGPTRPLDYRSGRPVWSVRIQHLLGLDVHPTVGPTGSPVVIELLTPADRPAQVTTDLPGFWRGSYAAVRAELRGRYPKHSWPEDPLSV